MLFQDAFSGRAVVGLTGDDNLHVKVSADGATWLEALVIDRTSGHVALPLSGLSPNLLVNGDFRNNQRVFAGGALAAGIYGFDRWKADTGGATMSANAGTDVLTLTSGTVLQVVEAALWLSPGKSFASQTLTLWLENLAGGNVSVTIGAQTATITAGSGKCKATVTLGAGETGNINVKLAPAAGAVTFKRVKLELGGVATDWCPRSAMVEQQLSERYFQKTYHSSVAPGTTGQFAGAVYYAFGSVVASQFAAPWLYKTRMRATPTVTSYSPSNGVAGNVDRGGSVAGFVTFVGDAGATVGTNDATPSAAFAFHATASAEL